MAQNADEAFDSLSRMERTVLPDEVKRIPRTSITSMTETGKARPFLQRSGVASASDVVPNSCKELSFHRIFKETKTSVTSWAIANTFSKKCQMK